MRRLIFWPENPIKSSHVKGVETGLSKRLITLILQPRHLPIKTRSGLGWHLKITFIAAMFQGVNATAAASPTFIARIHQCEVCHGKEGRSQNADQIPSLSGMSEKRLVNKLQNFKSEAVDQGTMHYMANELSEQEISNISHYFSKK
ncbi:MAG: hypothetical protein EB015_16820 [Methylocystaceae bacterium]|nr:hypothetical protein [Methylocystaceae bacterium]